MAITNSTTAKIILLIILAAVVYINSLRGAFIWDDSGLILENVEYLENVAGIKSIFLKSHFDNAPYYRPLLWTCFLLDYNLWGLNPLGFHVTNITLHIFNTVLVYSFFCSLGTAPLISFATAALFAAHPVQTEAVAWIAGRNDPLMVLFLLASLISLFKGRNTPRPLLKLLFYGMSCVSFACALLAKEAAVILIGLLVLIDLFFQKSRRRLAHMETLIMYGALAGTTLGFFLLRHIIITQPYLKLSFLPAIKAFATPFILYIYYLKVLFLPINLTVDPPFLQQCTANIFSAFFCITAFLSIVTGAFLFKKIFAEGLFGICWIIIYLLPVCGFVWMGVPILEHRAYGASIGFCFMLASLCYRFSLCRITVCTKYKWLKTWLPLCMILAIYSLLTVNRNFIWKDDSSVWNDTLNKSADSARALYNLGSTLLKQNKLEPAIDLLQRALQHYPDPDKIYNSLGVAFFAQGQYDNALDAFKKVITINPESSYGYYNMGILFKEQRDFESALTCFQKSLQLKPYFSKAYISRGMIYAQQGNREKEINEYQTALKISPYSSPLQNALGLFYAQQDDAEKAVEHYKKAISFDPSNYEALNNIALLYIKLGRFYDAIPYIKKALLIHSDSPELHLNLGISYFNTKNINEAIAEYKRALNLNPAFADVHFNIAVAYMCIPGKQNETLHHFNKVLELKPDHPQKKLILQTISNLK